MIRNYFFLLLFLLSASFGDKGSPYEDPTNKAYGGIGIRDTTGNWLSVSDSGHMNSLTVGYTGTTDQYPRLDPSTFSWQFVNYAHHELHEGNMYGICVNDADLDTDDTLSIAFFVPDTSKEIHLTFLVDNTVSGVFKALHDITPNDTSLGTDVAILNRNGVSSNVSLIQGINKLDTSVSVKNCGGFTGGTEFVRPTLIGAGTSPATAQGGSSRAEIEHILKPNSTHIFMLIGQADNGRVNLNLTWYEHTSKE